MKKKLLTAIMTLAVAVGGLALPQTGRDVKAGNGPVDICQRGADVNGADLNGSGSTSYDEINHKLTLNHFNVSVAGMSELIHVDGFDTLTIELVGDNTIESTGTGDGYTSGIESTVNIVFTGTGSLTLKAADANGNGEGTNGIKAKSVTVNSGTINVNAGKVESGNGKSHGIYAESVTIEGGTVNATSGRSETGESAGVCVDDGNGTITMNGGTLICRCDGEQHPGDENAGILGGNVVIGKDIVKFEAYGDTGAIGGAGKLKTAVNLTGWTNVEGTTGECTIAASDTARSVSPDIKKIYYKKPAAAPVVNPTPEPAPEPAKPVITEPVLTPSENFTTSIGLSTDTAIIPENKAPAISVPAGSKAKVKSSNPKVAKVKYNKKTGKITITGKKPGTATVSVKVNGVTETVTVEVKAEPFDVSPSTVDVNYKKKVNVSTVKKKDLKLSYDKTKVSAKYNKSKGIITIEGKAKAQTDVVVRYGDEEKVIHVNATATTDKLKLSKKTLTIKNGKAAQIGINATPKVSITGETPEITWDNHSVINVDYVAKNNKIKITPVSAGTAAVTVKVGSKTATLPVTVK